MKREEVREVLREIIWNESHSERERLLFSLLRLFDAIAPSSAASGAVERFIGKFEEVDEDGCVRVWCNVCAGRGAKSYMCDGCGGHGYVLRCAKPKPADRTFYHDGKQVTVGPMPDEGSAEKIAYENAILAWRTKAESAERSLAALRDALTRIDNLTGCLGADVKIRDIAREALHSTEATGGKNEAGGSAVGVHRSGPEAPPSAPPALHTPIP